MSLVKLGTLMEALTNWVCLLFFLKRTSDVLVPRLSVVLVWVVSRLAGDRSVSLIFRRVHRPPLLPITDRFL